MSRNNVAAYTEEFTNQSVVQVDHNADREWVSFRLVVGGFSREDLILSSEVNPADPRNSFIVTLSSPQTGRIQVFSESHITVNTPTATQTATIPEERNLIKVSSNDSTGGYLNGKLLAGSGISLVEASDGGNETLEISIAELTDAPILEIYDAAGGGSYTNSWDDVPFDTQRVAHTEFTHTPGSAEVTFNKADTYFGFYTVSLIDVSGSSRTQSRSRVVVDTGSGYAEYPGNRGLHYLRQNNYGASASHFFTYTSEIGDKLKVQAIRSVGGDTISREANGSKLLLFSLRGQQGPEGPPGASGDNDKVKVSANDTTEDFLLSKLSQGTGITITEQSDGSNETILISATGTAGTVDSTYWYGAEDFLLTDNGFPVNITASLIPDPDNTFILCRAFDSSTEESAALRLWVPAVKTSIKFIFVVKPRTAPGSDSTANVRIRAQGIPNNAALPGWSTAQDASQLFLSGSTNYRYLEQTWTLASLNLTAGETGYIQISRATTGDLPGDLLLSGVYVEFL